MKHTLLRIPVLLTGLLSLSLSGAQAQQARVRPTSAVSTGVAHALLPATSSNPSQRSTTTDPCNLVTNGDFETSSGTLNGGLANVNGPYAQANNLPNWQALNATSPDYYSTGAPT